MVASILRAPSLVSCACSMESRGDAAAHMGSRMRSTKVLSLLPPQSWPSGGDGLESHPLLAPCPRRSTEDEVANTTTGRSQLRRRNEVLSDAPRLSQVRGPIPVAEKTFFRIAVMAGRWESGVRTDLPLMASDQQFSRLCIRPVPDESFQEFSDCEARHH